MAKAEHKRANNKRRQTTRKSVAFADGETFNAKGSSEGLVQQMITSLKAFFASAIIFSYQRFIILTCNYFYFIALQV